MGGWGCRLCRHLREEEELSLGQEAQDGEQLLDPVGGDGRDEDIACVGVLRGRQNGPQLLTRKAHVHHHLLGRGCGRVGGMARVGAWPGRGVAVVGGAWPG